MTSGISEKSPSSHIGRSILALVAGMLTAIVLSIGTDLGLHAVGLTPSLGQPMSDRWLMLATTYRTIYGVIASYIVARLAPNRQMEQRSRPTLVSALIDRSFASVRLGWRKTARNAITLTYCSQHHVLSSVF